MTNYTLTSFTNAKTAEMPQPIENPRTAPTIGYNQAALEDRSSPRVKINMPARLRPSGCTSYPVLVSDISLSGFRAQAFTKQPVGARLWLTIPGLSALEAKIIHNDGTAVGCAFERLISQVVLENLVARYRPGDSL